MRAFGMPPSDPRIRQMNDAQWLWSYANIMKDEQGDAWAWEDRLDYIALYLNNEAARNIIDKRQTMRSETARPEPTRTKQQFKKSGVMSNDEFDLEAKAAYLGYNPSSGMTPAQFLAEREAEKEKQELDVMNASFDDLVNSGEFTQLFDNENERSDGTKTEEDFFSKVMAMAEAQQQVAPTPSEEKEVEVSLVTEEPAVEEQVEYPELDEFEIDEDV